MAVVPPRNVSEADRPPAVIVGVQLQGITDEAFGSSLTELERLAKTLGLAVIGRVTQKRPGLGASNLLGEGKLRELAEFTGGPGFVPGYAPPGSRSAAEADAPTLDQDPADEEGESRAQAITVLVDHDLSPTQMRNLERATGVEVLDRSMVILSIFQRHARTREARIQVEIARLVYMAPRLREANAGSERQRGGIGGKGAGESALELGRRAVRDRIAELRRTLVVVQREADTQRSRRSGERHPDGRPGRVHQCRQVAADARADQRLDVRRRSALRDARHHGPRPGAGDPSAHPGQRHGGVHQGPPPRPGGELSLDARRGKGRQPAPARGGRLGPGLPATSTR